MFGIGVQEMVLVGLLFLVIFGPSKLPGMARDLGRFVNEARRSVEEFKEHLVSEDGDGQQARNVQNPKASRELEEAVRREEVAVSDRTAERTKQRQR